MQSAAQDGPLPIREAARTIYDAVYPSEEWAPVGFDEAERYETVHYRNAVAAARSVFGHVIEGLGKLA